MIRHFLSIPSAGLYKDEINEEDIRFIIWNTLEKAPYNIRISIRWTGISKKPRIHFSGYWMKSMKRSRQ